MEQGDGLRLGDAAVEPAQHAVDVGDVPVLRRVPAAAPPVELPPRETLGAAQIAEADGGGVDGVQVGEDVDDRLADAPPQIGPVVEGGGQVAADDDAAAALQHVEVDAQDVRVGAEREAARREGEGVAEAGQHPVLARHVVGGGGDRPQGRPPQHVLGRPELQQVRQVRVPAPELPDRQRPRRLGKVRAQPRFQPRKLEPLVGPDVDDLGIDGGVHDGCFPVRCRHGRLYYPSRPGGVGSVRSGGNRGAGMRVIDGLDALEALAGTELGASEWMTVTQEMIDRFAEVTLDPQWIHVDRERAAAESPWGTTIAHGFLTLSLMPHFRRQISQVRGVSRAINYGVDRVRFPNAVKTGARVRGVQTLLTTKRVEPGLVRFTSRFVVEIEGESKPACVADTVTLVYA